MRISDWSSDVCSSDLARQDHDVHFGVAEEPEEMLVEDGVAAAGRIIKGGAEVAVCQQHRDRRGEHRQREQQQEGGDEHRPHEQRHLVQRHARRSEEQTSELQSLMRLSYAVFCLKKKNNTIKQ